MTIQMRHSCCASSRSILRSRRRSSSAATGTAFRWSTSRVRRCSRLVQPPLRLQAESMYYTRSRRPADYPIVFTQGDLAARNILVREGRIIALLDWEYAGWYPVYWEYVFALRGLDNLDGRPLADIFPFCFRNATTSNISLCGSSLAFIGTINQFKGRSYEGGITRDIREGSDSVLTQHYSCSLAMMRFQNIHSERWVLQWLAQLSVQVKVDPVTRWTLLCRRT